MSKNNVDDNQPVSWYRVTEHNSWEGETWYHYFRNAPGVYDALLTITQNTSNDLSVPTLVQLTWDQAEVLVNLEPGYIDIHWFGELTNTESLVIATEQDLYKGGIRNFGEELFGYETENTNKNED